MKYDKNAISNTARKLRSKSSDLGTIQTNLSRVSPKKCSSSFYSKRSSLVRRLSNVQSEINALSGDISNAASKMSSDDVQNAYHIRQVFSTRTPKISYGQRVFSTGNTTLKRTGVCGSSLLFSQMAMNRRSVSSLGNASLGSTPWYIKAGNFLRSGVTSAGEKVGEFGTKVWNGTSDFFSNAGKWGSERLNDLRDWGGSVGEYTWKSITKFVLGDYSDDNITALSFAGNIAAGIFDVDLPLDARDLVYDVQHWGEGDNFGVYFTLDVVALLPVIGVLKYCKYADDVADGAKDLGKIIEAGTDAGKAIDNISDAVDGTKDIGKVVDAAANAAKMTDTVVDSVDGVTDIGKNVNTAVDAGKVADNASDASKNLGKINPSKGIDPDAKPRGPKTKISDNMSDENIRSLTRENEAAEVMAKKGYDIEQNPIISGTTRNPDYIIEGKVFDCYSPTANKSVRGVWSTIYEKVITKGQTNRVVLNLNDWTGSVSDLITQLKNYKIEGLEEVIVVIGDKVTSIFP